MTATGLESKDIIRKHDDLVATSFMVVDQVLAGLELLRVHTPEQHPYPGIRPEVLAVEFGSHRAPHLGALGGGRQLRSRSQRKEHAVAYLYSGDVSFRGQLHPVRFVQLRSNHVVQVFDLVILSHKGRRQTKLRVRLDRGDDSSEHGRWHHVHFVQQHEAPFAGREELHHLLGLVRSILRIRHHGVRGHDDTRFAGKL